MPASNVRVNKKLEARKFGSVAEPRILPDFYGHEVLHDDTRIILGALLQPLPCLLDGSPERILSIEFHPGIVIDLTHEVHRASWDSHAEPRIFQCFKDVALHQEERPASTHDGHDPRTRIVTFPRSSARVDGRSEERRVGKECRSRW